MSDTAHHPPTLALFCKVIDNYGDIGICWRLARQLCHEHAIAVTLWVDDLVSFARLCPAVDIDAAAQHIEGVRVLHWRGQDGVFAPEEIADTVIEFFGVELPPGYVAAMAQCTPRPVWLNLEGMSAEAWVEGCHTLPSTHPRLPLVKHFFFPGFTARTGGLLREKDLAAERQRFQTDGASRAAFLTRLGLSAAEQAAFKVSLFCYPHAPVAPLLAAWQGGAAPLVCLVPEGVASAAVAAFLQAPAVAGAVRSEGALTVRVLPFVPQPDYDRLLWACDLNLVRGEDSIVRAQWAGRPFVWHIYPQDENLHHVKLRAFLQRFSPQLALANDFSLRWNGALIERNAGDDNSARIVDDSGDDSGGGTGDTTGADDGWRQAWHDYRATLAASSERVAAWQQEMVENGDLASNLLRFAETVRMANRSAHQ